MPTARAQARHEVAFLMLLQDKPNAQLFFNAGDIISDSEASGDEDEAATAAAAPEAEVSLYPTISGEDKEEGIKCLEFGQWVRAGPSCLRPVPLRLLTRTLLSI